MLQNWAPSRVGCAQEGQKPPGDGWENAWGAKACVGGASATIVGAEKGVEGDGGSSGTRVRALDADGGAIG